MDSLKVHTRCNTEFEDYQINNMETTHLEEEHHSDEDHHSDESHDHEHDHGEHASDADVVIISVVDIGILILCCMIVVHFIRYLKENRRLSKEVATSLFYKADIVCLSTIVLYTIIIMILIVHDILHLIELEARFHFEMGITQWILFFIARTWLVCTVVCILQMK